MRHLLASCVIVAGALLALAGCSRTSQGKGLASPAAVPATKRPVAAEPPAPVRTAPRPRDFALTGQLTQGGWMVGTAPAGAIAVSLNGQVLTLDSAGRFFAAFDRDGAAVATLRASYLDGTTLIRNLAIAPRAWNIEHIAVSRSPGGVTSAEFLRIREAELARINAARSLLPRSDGWQQRFIWPVRGRISGRFGSQRIYRGVPASYHSGTDIATGASGTPFAAPADGVVVLAAASPFTLEGNLLIIDHGMGLTSAFLHCSQLAVRVGDSVRQGQIVGRIGMTGRVTGPHLHWSLKWREARLDPELFSGTMR